MIKILIVFKSYLFLKNFENAQTNILKSANFFCFCFILYKEKMLLKVDNTVVSSEMLYFQKTVQKSASLTININNFQSFIKAKLKLKLLKI